MTVDFDPKPLVAFFKEVEEQLGISLKYLAENNGYPIQLVDLDQGLNRLQVTQLLEFIRSQINLKDAEIAKITASKHVGNQIIFISMLATKQLADVYALSSFYDPEND